MSEAGGGGADDGRRLDRWLWFARVVKSRTLAAGLVADGKVRVNRERVTKASHQVRIGDVLTITVGPRVRILKVLAAGERRGPASEARELFEDLSPPPEASPDRPSVPATDGERASGTGRPTKRDRRLPIG
ncbi:MAG TPA: RNA-binding S4 domain-containing protein [Hyphomicrobiaceae bacterium]|nr:RNA-binding S4 domain-containing protein [Hyphomicrobiaceae bacterium]